MKYKIALAISILFWLYVIIYVQNWAVTTLCAHLLKCL